MSSKSFRLLVFLLFLGGCKTASDIQRDQMIDQMALQLINNQKLMSSVSQRVQQLETRMGIVTGQFEEQTHQNRQMVQENLDQLKQQVTLLKEDLQTKEEVIERQQGQLQEQGKFIKGITNTLSKASRKQKRINPYDRAMSLYRKGKYTIARKELIQLADDNKIRGNRKARVLHNLGLIEYMAKRYDKTIIYMSKVFADHTNSPYTKRALLFLGKSFQAKGRKDEAKETWQELLKRYPKTSQAKEAKKLLDKLK